MLNENTAGPLDFSDAEWFKATPSNDQGLCVEVTFTMLDKAGVVGVRDSKEKGRGPVLAFEVTTFQKFVAAVHAGQFTKQAVGARQLVSA